jgi:DNA helicase-2/ATP-dependent DNA helicase PcrA
LAELMVRFQQEKRRRRLVDFDDLLNLAIRDLQEDPDYAAAVRWRHRHFFVDEFQDVNPLQEALLRAWLGDRDDLFVVGDPNQAIYGWNGADPGLIDAMAADPDTTVIRLDDNYRSSPEILAVAAVSLRPASAGPDRTPGLRAHSPSGPVPTISEFDDDRAEAAGLARAIRRARTADRPWAHQAVLVRTNAQLVVIEAGLRAAGIPARIRGGPGPLGSPEVKAELQSISRDGIDLVACLEDLDERLTVPRSGPPGADGPNPAGAAPPMTPAEAERRANLAALSRLIHEYIVGEPRPTGPGLLAWLNTLQPGDVDAEQADAVDLATFHGAKGLEWPVVHLAGLEDGYVPIVHAVTGPQRAEERRLLYVALTRAREELHLSWARRRTFGLSESERAPSPALERLARCLADLTPAHAPDPLRWRRHIEAGRSTLAGGDQTPSESGSPSTPGSGSDGDRAGSSGSAGNARQLRDELRRWRAVKARAARVPEGAIVDDHILDGLVEQRPVDLDGLAAVPGLRPTRAHRYGDELLSILAGDDGEPDRGTE